MRKHIFLPLSRFWVYLFELPLIALLIVSIRFHSRVDALFKLFPLEIALGAVIVFLPLYFFRVTVFSTDEVREIGLFSSRDRAIINKDKTLLLTLGTRGRLRVELFGQSGEEPAFPWQKNDAAYRPTDYCMLRSRAYGGRRAAARILALYGVPKDEAREAASLDGYRKDFGIITVSGEKKEGAQQLRIRFNETVL